MRAAITGFDALAAETPPDGMGIACTGEAATFVDGQSGVFAVSGLAFLLLFLALSARFERFVSAIGILLTVPSRPVPSRPVPSRPGWRRRCRRSR